MSTATSPELDLPVLTPMLDTKYALSIRQLGLVVGWGVFFMYLNYMPLFYTDLWGHVNYGRWMLQTGQLPVEDPFTPLAAGVPVTCTAWLSQLIFATVDRYLGTAWISNLYAITVLVEFLFLMRAFQHRSGSLLTAHAGAFLTLLIVLGRHAIARPETFGGLCFAIMIWLVSRSETWSVLKSSNGDETGAQPTATESSAPTEAWSWKQEPWSLWIGLPVLFMAWGNLHGSFVVGLILLGCICLGRIVEVAWKQGPAAVMQDRWIFRWLVMTELSAAAVLINPYGIDLYLNVLTFGKNPNLTDILEWFSLRMVDLEGITMAIAAVILLAAWRWSKAPVRVAEALALAIFAWSVCPTIRMINWFAPVFAWAIVPHLENIRQQIVQARPSLSEWNVLLDHRSFRQSMVGLFLIWIMFAFSPISDFLLSAKPRAGSSLYNKSTPRDISKFLRDNPMPGLVMAPQWWGDWLVWDGGPKLQIVMNTNAVHVAPRQVWLDYMDMSLARGNWERALDRYGINTMVVDTTLQPTLVRAMRKTGGWKVIYEDKLGRVYGRIGKIPKSLTMPKVEPEKKAPPQPATEETAAAPAQNRTPAS